MMKDSARSVARATLVFVLAFGLAVATSARPDPGPLRRGAFLRYPAYSVEGLIKQVQEEPKVRAHFAKYFKMSEPALIKYFQDNLTLGSVPATNRYTVYGVNWQTGRIFSVQQRLAKGTWVFTLRNSRSALKGTCGNPVILPRQETIIPPPLPPPLPPPTPASFFPPPPGTETAGEVAALEEMPVETVASVVPIEDVQSLQVAQIPHKGRFLPLFFPWHSGGGDHHEVPEPGTGLLVVAGLGLLALLRRRQRA